MRSDVGLWCWMMTTQRLLQFHSTWLMASQCSILLNSAPRSRWAAPSLQRFGKAWAGLARTNNLTRWWPGSGQCHHSWIWRWTWTWTDMDWENISGLNKTYWWILLPNYCKKDYNCETDLLPLKFSLLGRLCTCDQIECGNGLQLRVRTSPSAPLVQFLNIFFAQLQKYHFCLCVARIKMLAEFLG